MEGRLEGHRDSRRVFRTRLPRFYDARPEGGRGNRINTQFPKKVISEVKGKASSREAEQS
jgi:hypothetical protein